MSLPERRQPQPDAASAALRHPMARRPNPVFGPEYALLRSVLVEARTAAGVSQRALAARLGRSYSHIAQIEAGQRRVDTLEFIRICGALEADPQPLFADLVRRLGGGAR